MIRVSRSFAFRAGKRTRRVHYPHEDPVSSYNAPWACSFGGNLLGFTGDRILVTESRRRRQASSRRIRQEMGFRPCVHRVQASKPRTDLFFERCGARVADIRFPHDMRSSAPTPGGFFFLFTFFWVPVSARTPAVKLQPGPHHRKHGLRSWGAVAGKLERSTDVSPFTSKSTPSWRHVHVDGARWLVNLFKGQGQWH